MQAISEAADRTDLSLALKDAAREVLGDDFARTEIEPILETVMKIARVAAQSMVMDGAAAMRMDYDRQYRQAYADLEQQRRVFRDFREVLLPFMNVTLGPNERIAAILIEGPDGSIRTEAL